jgi:hypothetical protein
LDPTRVGIKLGLLMRYSNAPAGHVPDVVGACFP